MKINGEHVDYPTVKQLDREIARLLKVIDDNETNYALVTETHMKIAFLQFEKDRQKIDLRSK